MGKKLASTGVDAGNRFEIVLGGGGVRGYGHLGFLNAIEEAGFVVPVYTGVSVGSIVAAFYTNGYSPAEIVEIFQGEIFLLDPAKIARSMVPGSGGFSLEAIMKDLVANYRLRPRSNLRIVAYNILQRKPVVFEGKDYDLSRALSASCSIPLVMNPVWGSSETSLLEAFTGDPTKGLLVDGGVYHPCPVEFCKDPAIVAKLGFVSTMPSEFPGAADSYFHLMELAGSKLLAGFFPDPDAHLLVDVGVPDVSVLSFGVSTKARERMVETGYLRTIEALGKMKTD